MTIRREISTLTPPDTWESYVGSQTPAEFVKISLEMGAASPADACTRYANDLPNIFGEDCADLTPDEIEAIANRLAEYIEANI